MTAYFLTGALPAKGAVWRQNLPPFSPAAGWHSLRRGRLPRRQRL